MPTLLSCERASLMLRLRALSCSANPSDPGTGPVLGLSENITARTPGRPPVAVLPGLHAVWRAPGFGPFQQSK